MKNTVFYVPAIIFAAVFGWLYIEIGFTVSPFLYISLALFIISAIFLSKDRFEGGFLGVMPGIYLIYMSTKYTGPVIDIELPLGIIVIIFYLACCSFVFFKKRTQ